MGGTGQKRRRPCAIADPRGPSAKLGRKVSRSVVGRLSVRHGWRKVAPGTRHPKSDPQVQEAWKKIPDGIGRLAESGGSSGRWVCVMFQDEARFGRIVHIRRCWSPFPLRPEVANGYERQFVFAYGAVSPIEGDLGWKICSKMNTEGMERVLQQVSQAHPDEFIIMMVDGASSHRSRNLIVRENIRLDRLPGYAPGTKSAGTYLG